MTSLSADYGTHSGSFSLGRKTDIYKNNKGIESRKMSVHSGRDLSNSAVRLRESLEKRVSDIQVKKQDSSYKDHSKKPYSYK